MDLFKNLTRRYEARADLMGRMLERLGIDIERVARDGLGTRLRSMVNGCRACRQTEVCALWLDGKASGSYRDFCPNARLFDLYRR